LIFLACCPAMLFGLGCSKPAPSGPSFTASSGGSESDTPATTNATEPAATGEAEVSAKQTVAFVTNQIADFWKIAEAGCKDAEKDLDINVEVRMPSQATAVEQKRIVEDLLTSGVAAIAISPLDADNQIDWLNGIAEKVPLIKQALPDGGEVMLFIGRLEQDNSKYRRQGVIDVLMDRERDQAYYKSQPDAWDPVEDVIKGDKYSVLGTITDQGKPEVAQTKAEDSLNTYPEMDAMVGLFEYNPPACYQALDKAGKIGQVKLIGFDENDVTLQAIKDGECAGTVVQNPYMYGYESVRVLKALLAGDKSVIPESKFIDIPPRAITKENVDEYWADLKAKKGA